MQQGKLEPQASSEGHSEEYNSESCLDIQALALSATDIKPKKELLKRLEENAAIRRFPWTLFRRPQRPKYPVPKLLRTLTHPSDSRWRARSAAAAELSTADLDADQRAEVIETLCAIVENKMRRGRRNLYRLVRLMLRSTIISMPFAGYSLWEIFRDFIRPHKGITGMSINVPFVDYHLYRWLALFYVLALFTAIGFLMLTPIVAPLSLALDVFRSNRVRRAALKALGHFDAPESVGALAGAASDLSPKVRAEAVKALKSVMPALREDHYGRLSPETVPRLCRLLAHRNEPLVLMVLEALEKVGDSRACSPVAHVANRGRTPLLREAAERILPVLHQRRQQENDPDTLLRAAEGSAAPETLLRAVQSAAQSAPQSLLRPSALDET
jgi:hypothetical protein